MAESLRVLLLSFGLAGLLAGCATGRRHAARPHSDPGQTAFQAYCAACHVSNGPGTPAEAPPLDRSPWVAGEEDRLIKIVLQGLRGAIEVGGKTYNQEMPAVGKLLTDDQVASLLTFVRQRFATASKPVLPEDVRRVRAATRNRDDYWTAGELLKETR